MTQQVVVSGKEVLKIVGNYVLDNTNMTNVIASFRTEPSDPFKFCIVVKEAEK